MRKEVLASAASRTLQADGCDQWLRGLQAERAGFTSNAAFSVYSWSTVGRLSAELGVPTVL